MIRHLIGAGFLAASLVSSAVPAQTPTAPTPPVEQCLTPHAAFGGQLLYAKPAYDLKGAELASFIANLEHLSGTKSSAPVDEIWVFGPEDTFVLVVVMYQGCIVYAATTPEKVFLKILRDDTI